ncbi:protein Abitram-like isoform X1 [Acropora muricata]|uniref:protein Abitram-like isoform X1 n=1 Tax=Acropora muricata TaxID=159855 RepID=UPI0034E439A5
MADGIAERKTVVDRYFTRLYKTDIKGKPFEDQCVLQHSNKICVITVAPSHPLLQCKELLNVNFQVSKNVNRLDNKVSGKGKKGAQQLLPESIICEVTSSSGNIYSLYSCVKGKLVEVNEELVCNSNLLLEKRQRATLLLFFLNSLRTLWRDFLSRRNMTNSCKKEHRLIIPNQGTILSEC